MGRPKWAAQTQVACWTNQTNCGWSWPGTVQGIGCAVVSPMPKGGEPACGGGPATTRVCVTPQRGLLACVACWVCDAGVCGCLHPSSQVHVHRTLCCLAPLGVRPLHLPECAWNDEAECLLCRTIRSLHTRGGCVPCRLERWGGRGPRQPCTA